MFRKERKKKEKKDLIRYRKREREREKEMKKWLQEKVEALRLIFVICSANEGSLGGGEGEMVKEL